MISTRIFNDCHGFRLRMRLQLMTSSNRRLTWRLNARRGDTRLQLKCQQRRWHCFFDENDSNHFFFAPFLMADKNWLVMMMAKMGMKLHGKLVCSHAAPGEIKPDSRGCSARLKRALAAPVLTDSHQWRIIGAISYLFRFFYLVKYRFLRQKHF